MSTKENDITEACHKAMDAFGTARIVDERLRKLNFSYNIKEIMGFIVPLGVGSAALTLGIKGSLMPIVLIAAGIFSFIQTIVSLWSHINKWDYKLKRYLQSKGANYDFAEEFERIWKRYNDDEAKYAKLLEELIPKDKKQRDKDKELDITPEELRYGMREALHQYQLECATCHKKPDIKHPSECKTCGK